ncbi:gamma-glutamyltransferase, partial [Helicobacter aurati]
MVNRLIKRVIAISFLVCCLVVLQPFALLHAASYPPIRDTNGNGLAITSSEYATKIGKAILDKGGNAIDAAVAVGYVLAVTHPAAGNIGGGGFALIHLANGENVALDFRETAPLAATRDMYLDTKGNVIPNASTIGHLAAGVPGTVKGMSAMLDKYGTKKLGELIQPAIDLAENGFVITDRQAETMLEVKEHFAKFASSRRYFLKKDGSTYQGGDILVQKDLAKTLKLIQKEGESAFYQGKIADLIVEDMKNNGGIITKEDLAQYKVIWRKPVVGTYRGYQIVSMSPPSSGGTHLIQILNIMENANIKALGFNSSQTIRLMVEAMRQAYADRAVFMGDPDFFPIPLDTLLSKEYAKKIYANIQKTSRALSSKNIKAGLGIIKEEKAINPNAKGFKEGNHTTHYSVVDKWGNAVSVTYTI